MKKHILSFSFAFIALISVGFSASAQTGTYAITNAQIVTVSGATISNGTVVIRDGLIESVGRGASVPADAEVFDGKGLTVYPGLFDAYTSLGVQKAKQGAGQAKKTVSNYPAVLRPARRAFNSLKAGDGQFTSQRNNGITTALTVDSSGIFQGNSAVINLAGDTVSTMTVRPDFAQHVTYRTNRGARFPSSLMGTFAALRQMFSDAKRLDQIQKMYAKNPRGIRRPESDASLEALIPIVNGRKPIVFNANSERQIVRTLDLVKEFNLKAIISGGQEAWKVVDQLKASGIPVLLSLNFPKRTLSANKEADPEPLRILRLREEAPKNAARLSKAGVKFAFQSGGLKNMKDFLKNANEAVKYGLSKKDAIRAMTLSSAEILGVSNQLGSIQKGKIANLFVTKGDLFAKDKVITHVFVDGKLFKQKKKPKKNGATGARKGKLAKVGGTWNLTVEPPGQSIEVKLTLNQQGSTITGTLTSDFFGTAQIKNGSVTSNGFTFDATISVGGQSLDISFDGTVTGNKVEGTVDSSQGPAAFSGTKNP